MKKSYQSLEVNLNNNMKQVIHRKLAKTYFLQVLTVLLLTFTISIQAQDGNDCDPKKGKALFNTNCASCHKLDKDMTGPALRNVEARLSEEQGLDIEWLRAWIKNSAGMIKSGDAYANKIYKEYDGTAMTPFPQLSDQDICDILAYTSEEVIIPPPPNGNDYKGSQGDDTLEIIILAFLLLLFLMLAFGLYVVNKSLKQVKSGNNANIAVETQKSKPLWKAYLENQFLLLVTAIFLLLVTAYFAYGYMMQIGVDQNYEPIQPIHFSHRIHAGDNGIDCKYCHSSARVSKTSGIPSLNVCMNCHKSISEVTDATYKEGLEHGVDYNKEIQNYIRLVGWDGINKYTGETEAVEWIRIHNLPDFAYFNHSQHVTVAGVDCQTCHGPVEEMEIMYQYSPLTMGWCIDCHRETDVNVKDNGYYKKIHEELKKKYNKDVFTAAEMGALECGKCHY